jgi:acyl-CoA dehydrogenase
MQTTMEHWQLPFFDSLHAQMAHDLNAWCASQTIDESDDRLAVSNWVHQLGQAGWLKYCVPQAFGGALKQLDSRSLVVARETLSIYSALADFSFAMQGLGSGAITLEGTHEQQAHYLPLVAQGKAIAAFALSEEGAGSDVASMSTMAVKTEGGYVLNGEKMWISNGGLADFYVVFCKTDPALGSRGISAFVVDQGTQGLDDHEHLHVISPHPLSKLKFNDCFVPDSSLLGTINGGFKLAMKTLDIFRPSVAAAAIGMARRALLEAQQFASHRHMFKQRLIDFQMTQASLGNMLSLIESGALLTYKAAWMRDRTQGSMSSDKQSLQHYTQAAALSKLVATENAQKVIDMALQLHGGRGVQVGQKIESLYRDIRALRIYEGASEVQQLIIGRSLTTT